MGRSVGPPHAAGAPNHRRFASRLAAVPNCSAASTGGSVETDRSEPLPLARAFAVFLSIRVAYFVYSSLDRYTIIVHPCLLMPGFCFTVSVLWICAPCVRDGENGTYCTCRCPLDRCSTAMEGRVGVPVDLLDYSNAAVVLDLGLGFSIVGERWRTYERGKRMVR